MKSQWAKSIHIGGSTEPLCILQNWNWTLLNNSSLWLPSLRLWSPHSTFVSVHLTTLGALYVESYRDKYCLLWLAYFTGWCPQGSGHGAACLRSPPFYKAGIPFWCVFAYCLVCSVICWWTLGCLIFFAAVRNFHMNMSLQSLWWFLWVHTQEWEFHTYMVILISFFWGTTILCSVAAAPFYLSSSTVQVAQFFHHCQHSFCSSHHNVRWSSLDF